ncbi:hypothetical protein LWI28_012214 [Acer negundo]|uniref:Ribosomal protein 50S-L18Ae/60S-L20/60S-L18A domain-containing protein n=1 Tax=Acer negundo TaxID=4023 RepID=A0AAD5J4L0_ACENE|nr:hypothetical protein LWI28_012214 [Acer negundo]
MGVFRFHQYQMMGRALPIENDDHPKIYRMKLWATNEVRAKSKFWTLSVVGLSKSELKIPFQGLKSLSHGLICHSRA